MHSAVSLGGYPVPSIGGAPQSALEMGIAIAFRTSSTGLYLFNIENREESKASAEFAQNPLLFLWLHRWLFGAPKLRNKVDASRRAEKCRNLRVKVEDGVSGCA